MLAQLRSRPSGSYSHAGRLLSAEIGKLECYLRVQESAAWLPAFSAGSSVESLWNGWPTRFAGHPDIAEPAAAVDSRCALAAEPPTVRRMTDTPSGSPATSRAPGAVLLAIGVVFLAVGSSGQRGAFIAVGAAFIAIGVALLVRQRRAGGPK